MVNSSLFPQTKDERRRVCAKYDYGTVPMIELNILNMSGRLPNTIKTINPLRALDRFYDNRVAGIITPSS